MNIRGTGVGSALIALVFSVLCLTIFALISFTAADTDKAMADLAAQTVKGYYEADTLAEWIFAEIKTADTLPGAVKGIEITTVGKTVMFGCPVTDRKELYVKIDISGDSYDIMNWQMRDTGEWVADTALPVWQGE